MGNYEYTYDHQSVGVCCQKVYAVLMAVDSTPSKTKEFLLLLLCKSRVIDTRLFDSCNNISANSYLETLPHPRDALLKVDSGCHLAVIRLPF